jgi:SAM-dependent methyltransferase
MTGRFIHLEVAGQTLPGKVRDYRSTPVWEGYHQELLARSDVLAALNADEAPLPTTEAREGYYGDKHLEFWLSGARDAEIVMSNVSGDVRAVLDFGGASGRVTRHFARLAPSADIYLSDINPRHVDFVNTVFAPRVLAILNHGTTPHLPFPDNSLDLISAFSVFTHISTQSVAWLLELRRILRPGGILYATMHEDETWKALKTHWFGEACFSNPEFKQYYEEHPALDEPVAHRYHEGIDYNCNVFAPATYIKRVWGSLFDIESITPLLHSHQAGIVLRKPSA